MFLILRSVFRTLLGICNQEFLWKCLTAFSRWLFSHNSSIIDIWEYPKFAYFSSHTFSLHMFLTCGALLFSKQIFKSLKINNFHTLFKKCPNTEFFFWSVFSCIRTKYGDLLRKYQCSVRMQENTNQKKIRIWTHFTKW